MINITLIIVTCVQVLLSTIISLILALPIAYLITRFNIVGKNILINMLVMMYIMPSKILALCIRESYGISGLLGIVIVHVYLNVPLATFILATRLKSFDEHIRMLLHESGASRWQRLRDGYIYWLKPAIIDAACLISIACLMSFSVPMIMKTMHEHMTMECAAHEALTNGNNYLALWYGIAQACIFATIFFIRSCFSGKQSPVTHVFTPLRPVSYSIHEHGKSIGVFYSYIWIMLTSVFGAFGFLFFSLHSTNNAFVHTEWVWLLVRTITIAFFSAIGAITCAFALVLFVLHNHISQKIVGIAVLLPIATGHVLLGALFKSINPSILAYEQLSSIVLLTIINLPVAYSIMNSYSQSYMQEYDRLASAQGATWLQILYTIRIPYLLPTGRQAFFVLICLALNEVGALGIMTPTKTPTLAVAIRKELTSGSLSHALFLSLILCILVLLIVCTGNVIQKIKALSSQ